MGLESEAIYRIWDDTYRKVRRVGMARVQHGHGLEDLDNEKN